LADELKLVLILLLIFSYIPLYGSVKSMALFKKPLKNGFFGNGCEKSSPTGLAFWQLRLARIWKKKITISLFSIMKKKSAGRLCDWVILIIQFIAGLIGFIGLYLVLSSINTVSSTPFAYLSLYIAAVIMVFSIFLALIFYVKNRLCAKS